LNRFTEHRAGAWDVIYSIPANARTRAIRLLDDRAHALRASIHENFNTVWGAFVRVDVDSGSITISSDVEGEKYTKIQRLRNKYSADPEKLTR
jgi:hypothetical protein